MNNKGFHFYFYGLECIVLSSNPFFSKLLKSKFSDFKENTTIDFVRQKVKIIVTDEVKELTGRSVLGNGIHLSKNSIEFEHFYLGSKSQILIIFKKNNLDSIEIRLNPSSAIFNTLNMLSLNKLKLQLTQNIIKLYIEQTLLWYITKKKGIFGLHASAVEKNGNVFLFCGLNGVGKTSLAQLLIKKYGYKYFGDNYILVDKSSAYFSPDRIRISDQSIGSLNLRKDGDFGFGKLIVKLRDDQISKVKKARIAKVFIVIRSTEWKPSKLSSIDALNKINLMQSVNGEDISLAKVSNLFLLKENFGPAQVFPEANFFMLEMGKIDNFNSGLI